MNECQYETWSTYYDIPQIELHEINKVLSGSISSDIWNGKRVLEIGCGTGRFSLKILKYVKTLLAIDPDAERIAIFNKKLTHNKFRDKCTTLVGTLEEIYSREHFSEKFDLIIFIWSWAFIPNSEEIIDLSLDLLKDDGKIVLSMVVDGDFENFVYELNASVSNSDVEKELERNRKKIQDLRILLANRLVRVKEFQIVTCFEFDSIEIATEVVGYSVDENVNRETIYNSLLQFVDNTSNVVKMTDIVTCLCVAKLTHEEISTPAKITFNYKKCDNRGECSAEKICRTHRSAILRERTKGIWIVDRRKCDDCGRCRFVCELFNIHSSDAEVFEKLREIENMTIEPDFFDKDRYGSGSYHPAHKISSVEDLKKLIKTKDDIIIIEIDDVDRLTSSFDSILISDIIPKTYYDKYFYKYIIPKTIVEVAGEVQVKKRDIQHEELCSTIMQMFRLNELPALVFIRKGKVEERIEGIFRLVDHERCDYFVRNIRNFIEHWEELKNHDIVIK